MRGIKSCLKAHVIFRYASFLLIETIALLTLIQYTLKQSYKEELKNNILQSERKSMENMALNLDAQMKPYLNILYDTATSPELLLYLEEMGEGEPLSSRNRMEIQNFLKRKVMYSNKVLMLMVVGESGECVAYNKMDWNQNFVREAFAYEEARILYERVKATGSVQVCYDREQGEASTIVHIGVPLVGNYLSRKDVFSVVAATLDLDFLYDFFSGNSSDYVENYLVDADGNILMCRDLSQIGTAFGKTVSRKEDIRLEKTVNALGWKLFSQINQDELLKSNAGLNNQVSLIYIFSILFSTGFAIFVMLAMQKRVQEAEFEILESYINSHFIFNTLNVINYQVLESGNQKASRLIKGLANIMRYAFNSRLQYIYLYQEMLWVEQYLFLQSECNKRELRFEVLMEEDIAECAFRKMILQPFVENSIVHGLKDRANGKILVQAKGIGNGQVQIVVADNGWGIPEERRKTILKCIKNLENLSTGGIGIINVVTRLKYYFGEGVDFRIQSKEGEGTRIEITVPYTKLETMSAGRGRRKTKNSI